LFSNEKVRLPLVRWAKSTLSALFNWHCIAAFNGKRSMQARW